MEYAEVRVFSISDKVGSQSASTIPFAGCEMLTKSLFSTEPDHFMPPGPAAIGHPYQSVLQSAAAAAASLRHVAVPGGNGAEI